MPIMSAHGQNDARGAAFILARTALECISNPALAGEREVTLNNVYRLIEGYRADIFFDTRRRAKKHAKGAAGTLTLMPPSEQHIDEVRTALDLAMTKVFANSTKGKAFRFLEDVLRSIAYPQQFGKASRKDLNKAAQFFSEMLQNLHFA
jgi:hypothetical protein